MNTDKHRKNQLLVLLSILISYALLAFIAYTFIPLDMLQLKMVSASEKLVTGARWIMGIKQAGMVIIYLPLILAGYSFARKLDFPTVFRLGAGFRSWFLWPMLIGIGVGMILIVIDCIFRAIVSPVWLIHPDFPFSIIASATAAIGEEIIFRSFLMGLFVFLLTRVLKSKKMSNVAFWCGNILAAICFSAGHLPGTLQILNTTGLSEIPFTVIAEVFLICTLVGVIAGLWYRRDGLIAAIGIHFWIDIVWHVIWPVGPWYSG